MAKTLILGQTIEDQHGDVWDSAILSVDQIHLNYLSMTFKFRVDIYKNATSRTALKNPIPYWHTIDQATFMANFDTGQPVTSLKSQSEDYALTLVDPVNAPALLYGEQFE